MTLLLCAVSAFSQAGVASPDDGNQLGKETIRLMREKQIFTASTLPIFEHSADYAASPAHGTRELQMLDLHAQEFSPQLAPGVPMAARTDLALFLTDGRFSFDAQAKSIAATVDGPGPSTEVPTKPGEDSKSQPPVVGLRGSKPPDFNRDVYYRNKLEFSLDVGWHPINIPFPLDIFVGDAYNTYPLKYTLVPIFGSLRWQMNNVGLPWILRGNWDLTLTGSATAIPRGPESRYFAYLMGIRRNFVPRKGRIAPYFDVRLGVGHIDAKGPEGVKYAQGQDITFTINMGSGLRYNFSPRYALSAGMNFMHVSNLDLSESNGKPNWGVRNYGINVYGPMVGVDIQLRRPHRQSEQ